MRSSPSIAPHGHDTYLVLQDFSLLGHAWCETDLASATREAVIRDLVDGLYSNPIRIVAFNTSEGCPVT